MPRSAIEIPARIDFVSILDEDGVLDEALEPELSEELLLRMHDRMVLARRFDEEMLSLQRQGRLGTFAPVRGQEAAQVGSVAALEPSDWVVPSYREIAVAAWRELPLEGMLLYNAGYNEGGAIPEGENFLPSAVPVGSQMLHAAGIAYALRRRGEDAVAMTYFGDGATSEGDFHEALNFASVFDCPCVFVCQNNQYAISVPREQQTRSRTIAQKAIAYGMPAVLVDGNDVLAVHVAASEAVARAREEQRPTLIECVTYRLEVHTTVDDPSKYRSDEEVETWEQRDPLPRFQGYLKEKGLLDDKRIGRAEGAADEAIARALEAWEERMAEAEGPAVLFDHVYAEPPPGLRAQRERFEATWDELEAARREARERETEEAEAEDDGAEPDDGAESGTDGAETEADRDGGEDRRTRAEGDEEAEEADDDDDD